MEEWSPCSRTSFQTQTTGIYRSMISEWQQQLKSAGLWQYQTFRHYTILDCQMVLCARKPFFFFLSLSVLCVCVCTTVFLAGPHAICPFGMADQLNRLRVFIIYTKKKKCKKPTSVASAASSWLTGSRSLWAITVSRVSKREPGIAKPVTLFHCSHRIVDSSRQSSPGISPKDCFKYDKFWGVDNFLYKLIDSSVLCVSVKLNVHQDIWHQEGSVNNKNTTPCLHALQQRACTDN